MPCVNLCTVCAMRVTACVRTLELVCLGSKQILTFCHTHAPILTYYLVVLIYPVPPLQTPGLARDGLPGGGGRRSPSDGLPGGGGGDCKGISRQTVVPSTDASK